MLFLQFLAQMEGSVRTEQEVLRQLRVLRAVLALLPLLDRTSELVDLRESLRDLRHELRGELRRVRSA